MTLEKVLIGWRQLRRQVRLFWKLPDNWRLFTPGFSGICIVTAICAGLTYTSWALTRLLQSPTTVATLQSKLPRHVLELLPLLPELLEGSHSASELVAGALVTPQVYIYFYAFGSATAFCLVLLLIAFIRRW